MFLVLSQIVSLCVLSPSFLFEASKDRINPSGRSKWNDGAVQQMHGIKSIILQLQWWQWTMTPIGLLIFFLIRLLSFEVEVVAVEITSWKHRASPGICERTIAHSIIAIVHSIHFWRRTKMMMMMTIGVFAIFAKSVFPTETFAAQSYITTLGGKSNLSKLVTVRAC